MSQNYSGRLTIVVSGLLIALLVPLLAFSWLKPRPGIASTGGTILLYAIKSGDQAGGPNLAQEMVAVLKQRIDPTGTMNIVWITHGNSQIEIQFPCSTADEGAAQKQFGEARAELEATNIRVSDATDAIEGKNGKTPADLDKLADGSPGRKRIFDEMTDASAKLKQAAANQDVAGGFAARDNYDKLKTELARTNKSTTATEAVFRHRESMQQQLAMNVEWPDWPARVQALKAYEAAKTKLVQLAESQGSLVSPAKLKRMLRGSGVLEFHILPRGDDPELARTGGYAVWKDRLLKDGPRYRLGDVFKWFEVQDPDAFAGRNTVDYDQRTWVLASVQSGDSLDRQSGEWHLKKTRQQADQTGQLEVEFEFDSPGGVKFGNLTRAHVNEPMAIMLDDQVISAPNIQSPILTGSGVITGGSNGFTAQETDYLARMLSAGSLPARLSDEPISERTVGPQLGEHNLRARVIYGELGLLVVVIVVFVIACCRAGVAASRAKT